MYVLVVSIRVKPGSEEKFIRATELNHKGARTEPGNLRFDVIRSDEDPAVFRFYEVYRSLDDFKRHQQTAHYIRWRDDVADLMAEQRSAVRGANVFPADADWNR